MFKDDPGWEAFSTGRSEAATAGWRPNAGPSTLILLAHSRQIEQIGLTLLDRLRECVELPTILAEVAETVAQGVRETEAPSGGH